MIILSRLNFARGMGNAFSLRADLSKENVTVVVLEPFMLFWERYFFLRALTPLIQTADAGKTRKKIQNQL